MVGYADDTTIYAVIPRPPSCHQVMEQLNQDFVSIHSRCLKRHTRPNPEKAKSMARTYDAGCVHSKYALSFTGS